MVMVDAVFEVAVNSLLNGYCTVCWLRENWCEILGKSEFFLRALA